MARSKNFGVIRGKLGGYAWYKQKGVGDTIVRSINEGMSERVKTDAAFANTRLNAAEFGSAGSFSGAMVRVVSKRWRTILNPFATGQMTKEVQRLIKQDVTNDWGERVLSVAGWQDVVRARLNMLTKLSYADNFSTDITAHADAEGSPIAISVAITAQTSEALAARGAEGVVYEFYREVVGAPAFDPSAKAYTNATSEVVLMGSVDHEIGQALTEEVTTTTEATAEGTGEVVNLLVVALPYRMINNKQYILQELCSMHVSPIVLG